MEARSILSGSGDQTHTRHLDKQIHKIIKILFRKWGWREVAQLGLPMTSILLFIFLFSIFHRSQKSGGGVQLDTVPATVFLQDKR